MAWGPGFLRASNSFSQTSVPGPVYVPEEQWSQRRVCAISAPVVASANESDWVGHRGGLRPIFRPVLVAAGVPSVASVCRVDPELHRCIVQKHLSWRRRGHSVDATEATRGIQ